MSSTTIADVLLKAVNAEQVTAEELHQFTDVLVKLDQKPRRYGRTAQQQAPPVNINAEKLSAILALLMDPDSTEADRENAQAIAAMSDQEALALLRGEEHPVTRFRRFMYSSRGRQLIRHRSRHEVIQQSRQSRGGPRLAYIRMAGEADTPEAHQLSRVLTAMFEQYPQVAHDLLARVS